MADGHDCDIPFDRLSDADAAFVRKWNPPSFVVKTERAIRHSYDRTPEVSGMGGGKLDGYKFTIRGVNGIEYVSFKSDEQVSLAQALRLFISAAERHKNENLSDDFIEDLQGRGLDRKKRYCLGAAHGRPVFIVISGDKDPAAKGASRVTPDIAPYLFDFINGIRPDIEADKSERRESDAR